MAEAQSVTIPDKPAFKASEVCELAQIQPYVLRSWESEFPELGLSKTPGGPRIYRRTDVERVLRIRDLVFTEGLTLSGVRRRFDAEQPQPQDDLFSFVAEVQAAQAKAAQANAQGSAERGPGNRRLDEGGTPNAEVVSVAGADTGASPAPRRATHAKGAAAAASAQPELPGHGAASPSVAAPAVPAETRATIVQLKQDMQSLLDLLGGDATAPSGRSPSTPRRGRRG